MPTTAPADPIVEVDRVCPECGRAKPARDDPLARPRRIAHGAPTTRQGRGRIHLQEGPRERPRPRPLDRGDRRGGGLRRLPDRRRPADARRVATGDGRPEEDDRKGLRRAPPDPDPAGAAVPALGLRESILLPPRTEQHRRGGGPQDPEGTGEDRKLDVPVPRRDRGGGNLPRLPRARRAPAAEGDREDRGRERGDPPQPLPIHGGVHATAGPAARSCAETQRPGGAGRLNAATLEFTSGANRRKGLIWGACVPRVEPNGCLETKG